MAPLSILNTHFVQIVRRCDFYEKLQYGRHSGAITSVSATFFLVNFGFGFPKQPSFR